MNILKITEIEKNIILNAIKKYPLNMSAAAREANIPFNSFIRRAKKLNVYKPNPNGQHITKRENIKLMLWDDCSFAEKRRRVLEEQENKCQSCSLERWNGKEIVLELDHIDGNNENNVRENLRFLCPNCHAQTPTWRKGYKKGISDKQMIAALEKNQSIRAALKSLNLKISGGTHYARARKLIKRENIIMPRYAIW